jgi:hypothetical protein
MCEIENLDFFFARRAFVVCCARLDEDDDFFSCSGVWIKKRMFAKRIKKRDLFLEMLNPRP